jgi:hypothetical protein
MAFEVKDMSGSIFRNEEKTKETDRDYSGNGMIDGREIWISGWVNEAKNGKKYLKLTFKLKEEQKPAPKKADPISSGRSLMDEPDVDSIPF